MVRNTRLLSSALLEIAKDKELLDLEEPTDP